MSKFSDAYYETITHYLISGIKTDGIDALCIQYFNLWNKPDMNIVKLKKYLDRYFINEKGKWFKINTGKWNLKADMPHKYEKYMIMASDPNLLESFLCVYVLYSKRVSPQKLLLPSESDVPMSDASLTDMFSTLSVSKRKALTSQMRMHVWNEEQNRFHDMKWRGSPLFDSHTRACFACLNPVKSDDMDIAHIIPASRGGLDVLPNLRVSCIACNRGRDGMSNYHAYEWLIRNNKAGLEFISPFDPHLTTARALILLHDICGTIPGAKLPSLRDSVVDRFKEYNRILGRK